MIATFLIIIIIAYLILIGSLAFGFDKVDEFQLRDLKSKTKFSIIIPFRNEAENLASLLGSIAKLNYPKDLFEVILVDDESEDNSIAIINKILDAKSNKTTFARTDNIKIIQNRRISNSPKKDAITSAIHVANNEWIVTTDADCVLPKYWLDVYDEFIQTKQPNCIVAPVTYYGKTSFFSRFQTLDFLSLQGATIGGFGLNLPFLCNGANFAYRKSVFTKENGFDDNSDIASGDDIFLLEKFKKINAKKVNYLKNLKAIVHTTPVLTLSQLVQQRLRWASKTSRNPNWFSKLVGLVVLLANSICIAILPLLIFDLISNRVAIALLIIKFAIDFLLLFKTTRFFKQETLLLSYVFSCFLYPFFSVYIALTSVFKSYEWKGRTFKK